MTSLPKLLTTALLACALAMPAAGSAFAEKNFKKGGGGGGSKSGPQHSGNHGGGGKKLNNGAKAAIGIAAGLTALAIIANANKASASERPRGDRCRFLDRRCDDGERWACRKLRRDC